MLTCRMQNHMLSAARAAELSFGVLFVPANEVLRVTSPR